MIIEGVDVEGIPPLLQQLNFDARNSRSGIVYGKRCVMNLVHSRALSGGVGAPFLLMSILYHGVMRTRLRERL